VRRVTIILHLPDDHDWVQDPAPLELEITAHDRVVFAAVWNPHAADPFYIGEVGE
jgi:hypothetical protein